jgi:transcriptional regulator with XRE-family HTH domain
MHPTVGALLARYRRAAGLTQEHLAERAGLSAQTIGALERGLRQAPHRETVRLLSEALGLGHAERAALEAVAAPAPATPRSVHTRRLPMCAMLIPYRY